MEHILIESSQRQQPRKTAVYCLLVWVCGAFVTLLLLPMGVGWLGATYPPLVIVTTLSRFSSCGYSSFHGSYHECPRVWPPPIFQAQHFHFVKFIITVTPVCWTDRVKYDDPDRQQWQKGGGLVKRGGDIPQEEEIN